MTSALIPLMIIPVFIFVPVSVVVAFKALQRWSRKTVKIQEDWVIIDRYRKEVDSNKNM